MGLGKQGFDALFDGAEFLEHLLLGVIVEVHHIMMDGGGEFGGARLTAGLGHDNEAFELVDQRVHKAHMMQRAVTGNEGGEVLA